KDKKVDEGSNTPVIKALNTMLEMELAGVVRYTHYALMIYGYNRIAIVSWLRGQATESLDHANTAGELITHLGGHPALGIGPFFVTHNQDVGDIVREALAHETATVNAYRKLVKPAKGQSIMREEDTREIINTEELHRGEVDKMIRRPGDVA